MNQYRAGSLASFSALKADASKRPRGRNGSSPSYVCRSDEAEDTEDTEDSEDSDRGDYDGDRDGEDPTTCPTTSLRVGVQAAETMTQMAASALRLPCPPVVFAALDQLIYCMLVSETSRRMSEQYADTLDRLRSVLQLMRRFGPVHCGRLEAHAFGSTVCGMQILSSDLDVCIDGDITRAPSNSWRDDTPGRRLSEVVRFSQQKFLHELADLLIREGDADARTLERIIHARVPVFNYVDRATGVKVDVIVGGETFRFKASVLKILTCADWRFAALTRLVKIWAARYVLVDASMGLLNSYSLKLLVLFHLQNRPVPVLPKLAIPRGGAGLQGDWGLGGKGGDGGGGGGWDARHRPIRNDLGEGFEHDTQCRERMYLYVQEFTRHLLAPEGCYREMLGKNDETLAELFVSFMRFVKDLTELERTVGDGQLFQKLKLDPWHGTFCYGSEDSDRAYHIYVRDPFEERPDNAARSLSFAGAHAMHEACDEVCHRLDRLGAKAAEGGKEGAAVDYASILDVFAAGFGDDVAAVADDRLERAVGEPFDQAAILQYMRPSASDACMIGHARRLAEA